MPAPPLSLAAIRLPAFLYGPDGRIAAANDLAEALAGRPLTGCTAADIIAIFGERHRDGTVFAPDELPPSRALAGEEAIDVPIAVTTSDGRTVHALATASPLRDGDAIVGVLVIWQDVSALEAARAEQATRNHESGAIAEGLRGQDDELERQRGLLDAILGALPYRVSLWNRDERLVWANERFAAERGEPGEALVGRSWRELGDHAAMVEPLVGEGLEAIVTGTPVSREIETAGPGGREWRAVTFLPFGRDALLLITEDVTGRKRAGEALRESEERLRLAQESANVAVWDWDVRTGVYTSTPEFFRLYGLGEDRAITYDQWRARVHPDDVEWVETGSQEALARGEAFDMEHRIVRPSGEVRWIAATGRGVRDEQGAVVRVLGVNIDITGRKEADLRIARYAEDLARSNRELQRFAYVASHDLQEPLRSIVSFSQLLERRYKGRLGEDADEYIAFIVEGGTRMQALIRDLLQLSRVETMARPPVPTDANAVAADVARSLARTAGDLAVRITVEPLPTVMVDPPQLEQVLTNLVSNAIKYRRPGVPLEVRISATRRGDLWEIAVRDNGIGIEEDYFDRIFQMFQRLHTKEEYEGTGIGLAVVKKIVERHGGTIRVESTPGEGSTFFFTLPAA
ncbi:MAG: ATP-binding protein [Methanospirillum sp.]